MERLLSQTAISRLKPGDYLADRQTPGLRVEAFKARKSFIYRFRDVRTGKLRQVTIGDAEVVPIADARDQVRALQRARKGGADPRRVFEAPVGQILKQESQTNYSIRSLVNDYCADKLAPLKRGAERERMLRNDLSAWFPREAASVSHVDVRELVDSIVTRAPDIAGRVLRTAGSLQARGGARTDPGGYRPYARHCCAEGVALRAARSRLHGRRVAPVRPMAAEVGHIRGRA